jgi:hypothetical protein
MSSLFIFTGSLDSFDDDLSLLDETCLFMSLISFAGGVVSLGETSRPSLALQFRTSSPKFIFKLVELAGFLVLLSWLFSEIDSLAG